VETYVAFAADHLVAVVFGGKNLEGGFNETAAETEHEMQGGLLYQNQPSAKPKFLQTSKPELSFFRLAWPRLVVSAFIDPTHSFTVCPLPFSETHLLDVVIAQGSAILKLLAGENQALLVRWNTLLILDLGLDIVDCVTRLDFECDGLARQGLHEAVERRMGQFWFLEKGSFSMSENALWHGVRDFLGTYICTKRIVSSCWFPLL
jgi:hypothetical protein